MPMPFANEHAARQTEPDRYDEFRRIHPEGFPDGIDAILGITADEGSEIQTLRADSSEWTVAEFRTWLKAHDFKTTIEEAMNKPKKSLAQQVESILPPVSGRVLNPLVSDDWRAAVAAAKSGDLLMLSSPTGSTGAADLAVAAKCCDAAWLIECDDSPAARVELAKLATPFRFAGRNDRLFACSWARDGKPAVAKTEGPSQDMIRTALGAALDGLYPAPDDDERHVTPWVRDVFPADALVVYEYDGALYQIGYVYANGQATLTGDPVRVEIAYRPVGPQAVPVAQSAAVKRLLSQLPRELRIAKQGDEGYVLGIALEPNDGSDGEPMDPDAQADVYSVETVRKTAHKWAAEARKIGLMHDGNGPLDHAVFADTMVIPSESTGLWFGEKRVAKPGAWLLGFYLDTESDEWRGVKDGTYSGLSIEGMARRRGLSE